MSDTAAPARIGVRKTYKLYIGGAFPRSESGRSYVVTDHKGGFLANAALASRKDARDAVVAARKAFPGWSGRTAYNRGQVLYRVAEVMEDRRPQFVDGRPDATTLLLAGRQIPTDASSSVHITYFGPPSDPGTWFCPFDGWSYPRDWTRPEPPAGLYDGVMEGPGAYSGLP